MKEKEDGRRGLRYTIFFWLSLLMLIALGIFFSRESEQIPIFQGTNAFEELNWRFGEKAGELIAADMSSQVTLEPGKTYVLTADLSYDGKGDPYPSAFVAAGNLELEVYYKGNLVFHHTDEDQAFPKVQSVGSSTFTVSLGEDCQGKNFRIEMKNPLNHAVNRRLPGVRFGDHETQIRNVFLASLPSSLLTAALAFAMVILVMLGNTVDGSQWSYIYFAVFAMLIVQYRAIHDVFSMYIWANPFMMLLSEYFAVTACPIPLLMSYRYRMKPHYQWEFDVLIAISALNLALQNFLHFSGIWDVTDMQILTHIWILIVAGFLVFFIDETRKKTGEKGMLRKVLPIQIGTILDMLNYYLYKYSIAPGNYFLIGDFVGLGLLMTLILMILEARKARVAGYKEAERNRVLQKVAYTDVLTGINNRTAFTHHIRKAATGKIGGKSLLVVSADLNGLKYVNDNLGHSAGDLLIQRAANLLRKCLSPYGEVYRTGGDEFFALLVDVDQKLWEELRQDMDRLMEEENKGEEIPLSIAIGSAFMKGDISRALREADKQMYAEKSAHHAAREAAPK